MICLVYVSVAIRPFGDDDLLDLLKVSRRNNAGTGITGLLLYKDGGFMQALEGERRAVLDLYGRILRDDRHRSVVSLVRFAITERFFPDWSMGFHNIDGIAPADRAGLSDFLDKPFTDESYARSPHQAIRLLERFKQAAGGEG